MRTHHFAVRIVLRAGVHESDHESHSVEVPFVEIIGEGKSPRDTIVRQQPANDGVLNINLAQRNQTVRLANLTLYR